MGSSKPKISKAGENKLNNSISRIQINEKKEQVFL